MRRSWLPLALIPLVACSCKGKDEPQDSGAVPSPCDGLAATRSDVVGTAYALSWTTEEAGTPTVSLALDTGEVWTFDGTESGTAHEVLTWGLVAGGEYTWTATVSGPDGDITCPAQTLEVPEVTGILRFELNASEAGSAVADGYLVITTLQADGAWSAVVDGQGRYRLVVGTDAAGMTMAHTRIARDGRSILYNQFDQARVDDIGSIARVSFDGAVDTRTRTPLAHHDFVELPDGTFGWLGYDRRDHVMDPLTAPTGADMAAHCPGDLCPIAGEGIYEAPEGSTSETATEILNWWDDWDTDPWWVCGHMGEFGGFVPDYYEWFHANSLMYLDAEDAYYVNSRYQDTLFKVDRATGSILWQLGGADSDFTLTGGEWFDHGHMSDVWEGGFLVFDNGDHRGLTKLSEYAYDETARTVERVWSMDHPTGQMLPILGDVKRLPNGNRLVVWSADALVQELTPTGEVVWELQSASGGFGVVARADYITTLGVDATGG